MAWTLRDKSVLITGGNAGIGRATAIELARQGARVTITSRDRRRGEDAVEAIRSESGSDAVTMVELDLASFASIRSCAQTILDTHDTLQVLINNAGVILGERQETVDGFEMTFGVNHLGPFLLTRLLLERLRRSAPARIINVSSDAHRMSLGMAFDDLGRRRSFRTFPVYADSKLANIYFTRELSRRLVGSGVTVNAVHPGVIASRFGRDGDTGGMFGALLVVGAPFLSSPAKGARTSVYLAASPDVDGISGEYFASRKRKKPSRVARDDAAAARLWRISEGMLESADHEPRAVAGALPERGG